ncbi:MAG: hypothetical protein IH897_06925 [Planctomycetes bacterium]|nr:hypothetical protein [Planctomycetota bacterium]
MKIRLQPRRQHTQNRVLVESCAVVLAIEVCLLLSSCKGDSDDAQETRSNGTQTMTERLRRISDDVDLEAFKWANARRAEELSRRPLPPSDSQQGLLMRSLLAHELLWAGRTEEAIERFQEIEQLFLKHKVGPKSLRQVRDGLASAFLRLAEKETVSRTIQRIPASCPSADWACTPYKRARETPCECFSILWGATPMISRCAGSSTSPT